MQKEKERAILVSKGRPVVESHAVVLPHAAKKLHGCVHCEWKLHGLCPSGYTHKSVPGKPNCRQSGICEERKAWLMSFTRPYKERPTFVQWQRDFNRAMGQVMLHKDYTQIQIIESQVKSLEKELKELRSDGASDDSIKEQKSRIIEIKVEKAYLRKQFLDLWKELSRIDESQLNRETPKKLEIDVSEKLPLSEIHRLMKEGRREILDAEIVEEGEDDGKEK